MPLCDFILSLGSRTPSPGGGSASAAVAAIVCNTENIYTLSTEQYYIVVQKQDLLYWGLYLQGAALSTMVGWMTFGKKKYEGLDSTMRKLIPPIYQAMKDLTILVDADTEAFNMYMVSYIMKSLKLLCKERYIDCKFP